MTKPRTASRESLRLPSAGAPRLLPVLAAVALCGLFLYFPTFAASFAYDDVDYLHQAADTIAGKQPYWKMAFRPQGEHFLPILRMVIHANALFFGTNALPLRLLAFAAHLSSAFFLALVARRYLRSRAAFYAAGLAYVAPAGFSSMWVWFPSGGSVPLGLVGITGALAALAHGERLGTGRARLLAGAGVIWAVLCDNALTPLLAVPALLDEFERRQEGRRGVGPFALFCAAVGLASVALTWAYYPRWTGNRIALHPRAGALRTAFLLIVAPFRFFFPGVTLPVALGPWERFPIAAAHFGIVVFAALTALFSAVFRPELRPLTGAALATCPGAIGFVALAALGRWWNSYDELYEADRYFFTLFIPVSLLTAALAHGVAARLEPLGRGRRRLVIALLLAAGLCELALHRRALLRRVPWSVYAAHEERFRQLELLGQRLSEAARALPPGAPALRFPDTGFGLDDFHNRRISPRLLLYVANRHGTERLELSPPPVSARDEALLNSVLERWTREAGKDPPALSIVCGDLTETRRGDVDFRVKPHDSEVVSGFHGWENVCRWMGKRGELRLRMAGRKLGLMLALPLDASASRYPERGPLRLSVTVRDEQSGDSVALPRLEIAPDGIETRVLPVPEPFAASSRGHPVRLILEADYTWRPVDVLSNSIDTRELSVQIYRAGFDD